jgi:hypothetical protein
LELFRFIDWVMTLPPALDEAFEAELAAYEEAQRMRYVTTIEQRAEQRGIAQGIAQGIEQGTAQGIEQGIEQGIRQAILDLLEIRFPQALGDIGDRLAHLDDVEVLRTLLRQAVAVVSLDGFRQSVEQAIASQADKP